MDMALVLLSSMQASHCSTQCGRQYFLVALVCRCFVTKSQYTEEEDFTKADAVYDCIGDKGDERFSYSDMIKEKSLQGTNA